MFMKYGENGPETSPQSIRGDGDGWYPVVLARKQHFNPLTQSITYEKVGDMIYERVVGDPTPLYFQSRRSEYPDIRDQLDAIWKGGEAMESMRQKIMDIKGKWPKPE